MRKIFAMILTVVLTLSLSAVTAENAGMANPWIELESPEELNEKAGTYLQLPGVMGVRVKACRLMNQGEPMLAEVIFEVNGMEYTLRTAGCVEDISGFYMPDGKTAFEGREYDSFAIVNAEEMKLARWLNLDGQYILYVRDGGTMEEETFAGIAEEMFLLTNRFSLPEIAEGTYYDSVSMRAYAEVSMIEEGKYAIEVHWSDSVSEDNQWNMTAVLTEDGLLVYDDCEEKHVVTMEDGSSTEVYANLIPEGYFAVSEGKLLWTGAADESCRDCVFELAGK